jgi:PHP family Zn ribbon phosphoesterase
LHLPDIKNDPGRFGYQVVVDADNMIVFEEERLLISAIDQSIGQLEQKVHELNGLFIPAHIDRLRFGLLGQLGFVPADLNADGFEISTNCIPEAFISQHPELSGHQIISGSDAHHPDQIGRRVTVFEMDNADFECFRLALRSKHLGTVKILI